MLTLSKGFLKPQPGDTGDVVFPALQTDIQQLNDHNHDGVNSQQLAVLTQNILAVNWVAAPIGGGLFRQLVTMPVGPQYDTTDMFFRLSTGEVIYPTIERVSATSFYIYINDNTKAVTAFYR